MKKMNSNYEAPKAEMVELYAKNEVMQVASFNDSTHESEGD